MYLLMIFCVFIIFAFMGMPLSMAIGLSSMIFLIFDVGVPISVMAQMTFAGIDSFPLMAIPFFILAGSLMNYGGLTNKIIDFSNAMVGHRRGGLGQISVISNMFFGAISGSAVAGASAMGSVLIPSMIKEKYGKPYAAALIALSSGLAPIIPPSISMIMYGIVTGTSIEKLFIGGLIPGIIYGGAMMLLNIHIAKKRQLPCNPKVSWTQRGHIFMRVLWALLLPVIIFGGILSGVFTVTESAAIAAIYALIVGILTRKTLRSKSGFIEAFGGSVITIAVVMFLIASSKLYSYLLAINQVPQMVSSEILALSSEPLMILLLLNIALLIIGMFLETNSAIVIFVPIFYPIILELGIDPIHFGVILVFNLSLGLVTPPFGLCISLTSKMAGVKLKDGIKETLPYLGAGIITLALITYVPNLVLYLPNHLIK